MRKMTPNERWQALRDKKPVDRLPITLCHAGYAAHLAGMNYRESFNTADKLAKRELTIYRKLHLDAVSVSYTSVNFAIRHRSRIKCPRESAASVSHHILQTLDDLDCLDCERTAFDHDIAQRINIAALEMIEQAIGHELHPTYSISAPFTLASGVFPAEKMLRSTRKEPEKLHSLLQFTLECILQIIDRALELPNINFFIFDPVASGALISPKQYEKFVLPYTKQMVEYIKKANRCVGMHICGDVTKHLPYIQQTGIDMLSVDQMVDLAVAKSIIGEQVALMGNIDPVRYFLQGKPEEVKQATQQAFAQAGDNPSGFIIRSGCQLPVETPDVNVQAFMEVAEREAIYYGQRYNQNLNKEC